MTKLFLVRHGATDWNQTKRAQGWADIELNGDGRKQAIEAAGKLAEEPIKAVYSSDLKRAFHTAEPIAQAHGLEVVTDPDLREIDQGEWTGLEVTEIQKRWPIEWGPARHFTPRPGGESPQQVRTRALDATRRILEKYPEGAVVIVSHGGTIRWISAEALGYDDKRSARLRGLGNGGIVCIEGSLEGGELHLSNLQRLDGSTLDLDDPND